MGEEQLTLFRLDFNRSIRVEARPERLTAEAGALLLRSLVDRLGFAELVRRHLPDARDRSRIRHAFVELLRTQLLLVSQGWSDQRDVALLAGDPALRLAVSGRRSLAPLASTLSSQPTLSRLQHALGTWENREGLQALLRELARRLARLGAGARLQEAVLDLDSLPLEVFGHQPGSAWNGHYACRCYHPLVLRWERGDFLAAALREGNAHTADGALAFILPSVLWAKSVAERVWVRMDAGFPEDELLSTLEEEDVRYVARLRGNRALDALASPYLRRPAGRPPAEGRLWTHELTYRAGRWERSRRVVLVVLERADEQHPLFLDPFFLLTNVAAEEVDGAALLERYRQRGTAERDFGEWQNALGLALSSAPRPKTHYRGRPVEGEGDSEPDSFAANEVRLLLSLLAANVLRAGALRVSRHGEATLSRERFRQLVLKAAGRVLVPGRRITLVVEQAKAGLWRHFWTELERLYPARGSPALQALPPST